MSTSLLDMLTATRAWPQAETAPQTPAARSDAAVDHSQRAHARLSASGAYRFIACPGSVALCEGRDSPSSEHAREGTAAHEMAQLCLEQGQDAIDYVDRHVEGFYVDTEWAEALQVYLDHCRKRMGDGYTYWIERRITLEKLNPPVDMFGTSDFAAIHHDLKTLYVDDLKWGRGIAVAADNNPQLKYYALGVLLSLPASQDVETVVMSIVQPRGRSGPPVKTATISATELLCWAQELMVAARKTQEPNAPLAAGSHCRFCTASGICPEQANKALASAQVEFADVISPQKALSVPSVITLSAEALGQIILKKAGIIAFLEAAEAAGRAQILAGMTVPGIKAVAGVGRSKWADAPEMVGPMLVDGFGIPEALAYEPREPISSAKARAVYARIEKEAGRAKTLKAAEAAFRALAAEMITTASGIILVADDDDRPAVNLLAGSEFSAIAGITPETAAATK